MSADLIGSRVACVTTFGDVYTGTMLSVDGQHNIALADVVVSAYPKTGKESSSTPSLPSSSQSVLGTMFVRGSSVLYIDVSKQS